VITVGALSPDLGEKALNDGDADIVAYGRQLIADADLAVKIKEDRIEDIRTCCRGHEGCISLFFAGCPIRCEVNPQAGRERDYAIKKACEPKNIVVVGGGVSGMEAARVAALYGHKVTLIEKGSQLGGHYNEATKPTFKSEGGELLKWLVRQVNLGGIEVKLNQQADSAYINSLGADAVIVAVGSEYICLPISGIEKALTPDVVLNDAGKAGANVAVIGGGLIGTEVALHLAQNGKKVTVFEMLPDIAMNEEPLSNIAIKLQLDRAGVVIHTSCQVKSVQDGGLTYSDADGNEKTITADTVVAATGLQSAKDETDLLADVAGEVYLIGDCKEARKLYECFHEAWHTVRSITGEM